MDDVLADITATVKKAVGSKRVCLILAMDANAQLPRGIPSRTGRWCVRKEGNEQGRKVIRMMDELSLFASSTGNSARPRRRGGAATYSVMEKTSVRAEKRVQLDYVMMSDDFRQGSRRAWVPGD